jgi:predicted site-specific integrase-resolvase
MTRFKDRLAESGFLTITEVAGRTRLHRATIYRWMQKGLIEAEQLNNISYLKWSSVLKHIKKHAPGLANLISEEEGGAGADAE